MAKTYNIRVILVDGEHDMMSVRVSREFNYRGHKLFVHPPLDYAGEPIKGLYRVSEKTTGLSVGRDQKNINAAIQDAKERIEKMGGLIEYVERARKMYGWTNEEEQSDDR